MKKALIVILLLSVLVIPVRADDNVIYSWHSNEKKIALTFDDGPHPELTREILDILDEYGVKATFFVIGENAGWYPELVAEEYNRGHEIGNHTFDHGDMKKLTTDQIKAEIESTENAVYENIEYRTKFFRPPGGLIGNSVLSAASDEDYRIVCWSVDTRDWAHTPVDKIVENVLTNTGEGDIILFHDYISGDSPTPAALRKIIPELLSRGYTFVTISELVNSD